MINSALGEKGKERLAVLKTVAIQQKFYVIILIFRCKWQSHWADCEEITSWGAYGLHIAVQKRKKTVVSKTTFPLLRRVKKVHSSLLDSRGGETQWRKQGRSLHAHMLKKLLGKMTAVRTAMILLNSVPSGETFIIFF